MNSFEKHFVILRNDAGFHTHINRVDANTDASRLAAKHPDNKFYIYEVVAVAHVAYNPVKIEEIE